MTKPAGTPRKKPEPRRRKLSGHPGSERLAPLTLSPPTLRNDLVNSWPTPPETTTRTGCAKPQQDPTRGFFLGSTSYASVFVEEQPLPDSVHEQPSERTSRTPSVSDRTVLGSRHCQIGIGHSIVTKLLPISFFEKSFKLYFEHQKASALIGPLVISALPQLGLDLAQLANPENDAAAMYAEMTRNTARPMRVPANMPPSEFHTLWTGKNLRWETLGLILAIVCSNAQFTSPHDPIFTLDDGTRLNRDELIEDMIHASNDCIHLCQIHGAVNDIMVWLIYTNMLIISNFYGDNCKITTTIEAYCPYTEQITAHGDDLATVSRPSMLQVCTAKAATLNEKSQSPCFFVNQEDESTLPYTGSTKPSRSSSVDRQ